jgi:hypothetical protein
MVQTNGPTLSLCTLAGTANKPPLLHSRFALIAKLSLGTPVRMAVQLPEVERVPPRGTR